MSAERVITVGHESNEVLLSAVQRVLEKVGQDPLHAAAAYGALATTSMFVASCRSPGTSPSRRFTVQSAGATRSAAAPPTVSGSRFASRASDTR